MKLMLRPASLMMLIVLLRATPALAAAEPPGNGWFSSFRSLCKRVSSQVGAGVPGSSVRLPEIIPTLDEIAGFAQSKLPHIGVLSATERTALQRAWDLSESPEWVVAFLSSYTGPREKLEQALNWNSERLEAVAAAPQDAFPVETWLDLPGFESVRAAWGKYKGENWKAIHDPTQLTKTQYAKVKPDSKEIIFRNSISGDPKPLTIAEEIFHIESIQDAALNKTILSNWLREIIGEVVFEKELAGVSQLDRFDWQFLAMHKQRLKAIPESEVHRAIVFLIERDAMLKNLELYKALIKTHPEFRNELWDGLAASQFPAAKMSSVLNQQERFKLEPKVVELLDQYTLNDAIHALGGQTVSERDLQVARNSAPPPPRPEFLAADTRIDWNLIDQLDRSDQTAGTSRAVEAGLFEMQTELSPDAKSRHTHRVSSAVEKAAISETPGQPARDAKAIAKFVDVLVDSAAFRGFCVDTNSANDIRSLLRTAQKLSPENRPDPDKVSRMAMGFIQVNGTPGIAGRDTESTALNLHRAEEVAKSAAAYFKAINDVTRATQWAARAERAEDTLQRDLRDSKQRRERRK